MKHVSSFSSPLQTSLETNVPKKAQLTVILSPYEIGTYEESGGVSMYADERYTRAWPGGIGNAKLGA